MNWFKKLELSLLWLFISLHNLHFIKKAINSLRKVNVIEFTSSSSASHDYRRWYFLILLKLYINPLEKDSDICEVFHLGFTKYYDSSILTFPVFFLSALYMSHRNAIIITFLIIFKSNLVVKGLPVENKGQARKRKKN